MSRLLFHLPILIKFFHRGNLIKYARKFLSLNYTNERTHVFHFFFNDLVGQLLELLTVGRLKLIRKRYILPMFYCSKKKSKKLCINLFHVFTEPPPPIPEFIFVWKASLKPSRGKVKENGYWPSSFRCLCLNEKRDPNLTRERGTNTPSSLEFVFVRDREDRASLFPNSEIRWRWWGRGAEEAPKLLII